jgi:hypothetical protein
MSISSSGHVGITIASGVEEEKIGTDLEVYDHMMIIILQPVAHHV